MFLNRRHTGFCLPALALVLVLVGAAWAQTPEPTSPEPAALYHQAVALLDQAEQQLNAENLAAALALVKQANALFTRLQKECAAALVGRQLSRKDEQQVAINEKLAADAQAQADRLLEAAAAKKKQALELQPQTEAAETAWRESRAGYLQSQTLSIKAAIYALRNQQIIFRFLAP
jgi:hypothetical protein